MDDRGFIFTSDLLLAMVIVTMAIGLTTSTHESLNYQIQDFSARQSLERRVNDAADYLVKSPGNPTDWERKAVKTSLPGLAAIDRGLPDSHHLHNRKVIALKENPDLLSNLVHTSNYNLTITCVNTSQSLISIGTRVPPAAKEVAVANRTAVFMPGEVMFEMIDLSRINPVHPGGTTHLWFSGKGKGVAAPRVFVGPGNVTTKVSSASSFFVTQQDIDTFDFFIVINDNTGVSSAWYGFTDGDAVVNDTFGGLDDHKRREAIEAELKRVRVHGGGKWQKLKPLTTGSVIRVNDDLQRVLNCTRGLGPDMKMWVRLASDPKANFDISLVRVFRGHELRRIPVKVVLKIWE